MNLNHLQSFFSIAEHGSFSKAAKAMHISSQALLQQMQILEREVGASLFHRSHRGVSLTQAGRHFYDGVKHILSYTEALRKLCQETLFTDNELRVGTCQEITSTFIFRVSYEYRKAHPNAALSIVNTDSAIRFAQLLDSNLDLCESHNVETIGQYGLEYSPVITAAHRHCIVSKKHPLAKKEVITVADLKDQTLLLGTSLTDSFGNPQLNIKEYGVNTKQFSNHASKKLETALGNAIYFDYLFDKPDSNYFNAVPFTDPHPRTFGFVHKKNPSTEIKRFLKIASKIGDSLNDDIQI